MADTIVDDDAMSSALANANFDIVKSIVLINRPIEQLPTDLAALRFAKSILLDAFEMD